MLQAQHNGREYTVTNFITADEPIAEFTNRIYKKVKGWESEVSKAGESGASLDGFPSSEILELIDRFRIPLAEKVFDAEVLSPMEQSYLTILEDLTDALLNAISSMPEEPQDVKSALLHAKRLMQGR